MAVKKKTCGDPCLKPSYRIGPLPRSCRSCSTFTRLCMLEKYPSMEPLRFSRCQKKLQTIQMIDFRLIAIFGHFIKPSFASFYVLLHWNRSNLQNIIVFAQAKVWKSFADGKQYLRKMFWHTLFPFGWQASLLQKTFDRLHWTAAADFPRNRCATRVC